MIKKLFLAIFISIIVPFSLSTATFATKERIDDQPSRTQSSEITDNQDEESDDPLQFDSDALFAGDCRFLLGLTSWDCGVSISNEQTLTYGIWQIAVNVLTNISVISAYLVLGYVIYGGYLYTMSGGSADKIANGKKTITRAFIGLAIVSLANIILNTIRFILIGAGGKENSFLNCVKAGSCVAPETLITNSIQWVVGIVGVVAVIFIIYGGITLMTSTGDPGKVKKGKDMIIYSVIGLIVVVLAEIITAFVSNIINSAS